MAKGQMKSTKEAKKPKKDAAVSKSAAGAPATGDTTKKKK